MKLVTALNYPQVHFGEFSLKRTVAAGETGQLIPAGHYAYAAEEDDGVILTRDPLGCNKLFFGFNSRRNLVVANRISHAWEHGVRLGDLYSCPPGHVLIVDGEGVRDLGGVDVASVAERRDFDASGFREEVGIRLEETFRSISKKYPERKFVVCLSGGLDSTIIAFYAAKCLSNVVAVSFTYLDDDDLRRADAGEAVAGLASASEDFRCAARVAPLVGVPFSPVVRSPQAVSDVVSTAVALAQDWRDFNVHCATVNVFLAQGIKALFPDEDIMVLTGDLMNELVCDYAEETVGSDVYYRIPRVPPKRLRQFLVRGLDAGDREIGVFNGFGLSVCQPFAAVADTFMRVPADVLERPGAKRSLNGGLLPGEVLDQVNPKKTRAQVGGKDMGTLGIFHRMAMDQDRLEQIWLTQFPGEPAASGQGLIEFGRYKAPPYATVQ